MSLNFYGLIIGIVMLISTGIGHIIVIKGEYHFGTKLWPLFLIVGILSISLSFIIESMLLSGSLGIIGITFLWGIHEIIEQKERVNRGWFPKKRNG
ncbi:DUF4491 family protein [Clostridium malenominatum]|uniref:DUF4491 family protein n=1 Tax=Clostridium malenominatum TaxID=1539 RepID=A0ABN1ISI7_9CLOT